MSERDRQAILARRRFFVASALAGLAATQCDKQPQPCLNVAEPPRADAAAGPTPTPAATPEESAPQPCLEYAPPPEPKADAQAVIPPPEPSAVPTTKKPEPQPCLKIAVPRDFDRKR